MVFFLGYRVVRNMAATLNVIVVMLIAHITHHRQNVKNLISNFFGIVMNSLNVKFQLSNFKTE